MYKVEDFFLLIVLAFTIALLNSCGSVKLSQMRMLEGVQNEQATLDSIPVLKIQPDDILHIKVVSRNMEAVLPFQMDRRNPGFGGAGEQASGNIEGYLVDEEGNIYLPFLGKVEANGKTILQLREEIREALLRYIQDVSVQIRFLNFRVTVLGEVNRPNTYIIPNEKMTIFEAIGMAEDFTPYAQRNSVLVIRERQNQREFARVDTQGMELFKSPYFYLSPNDIVYVEPLKAKQYATQGDFFQRYAFVLVPVASVLSSIAVAALLNNN